MKRISTSFSAIFAALSLAAIAAAAHAQGAASAPIKAGLWETTVNSTSQIKLPPEVQARLDALPPDQQAMMKAHMPGGAGAPNTTKTHFCSTGQSISELLNQSQQKTTQCKLTNQTQTGKNMSFDIVCTMPQGSANGHSSFTMADSDHLSGSTHMNATTTSAKGSGSIVMDSQVSAHYLGSDCGSVAPNSSVVLDR